MLGMLGEQREIHAFTIPGGAARIGAAWPHCADRCHDWSVVIPKVVIFCSSSHCATDGKGAIQGAGESEPVTKLRLPWMLLAFLSSFGLGVPRPPLEKFCRALLPAQPERQRQRERHAREN